ncbi:MAG: 3-deoxy-8-phosphooctulonate synthase [Dysgonamonadaceae bacterium]|nr:3-deoxy-8-phosphooctulonate synthase [Dysgonamonadaceae bacterium]
MTIDSLKTSDNMFFLIAGPCVIEDEAMAMNIAETVLTVSGELGIPYVFKGSFKKANRSKMDSFTGIGTVRALNILRKVRETFGIPTLTDIHETTDAAMAAEYVDILQIPAFLCRQTDLLIAAAETGKVVNIKKGQFLSPAAMGFAVQKVVESGNRQVMLTERGVSFGYSDLVVDFRAIPEMQQFGYPVIMDVTHAMQRPNQAGGITGGTPQMTGIIARAAIAAGADGLFIETHPDPSKALSDRDTQLSLGSIRPLLETLARISAAIGTDAGNV